jgi:hypothetical protein
VDALAIGLSILNKANLAEELMDEPLEAEFEELADDWMGAP